MTEPNRTSEAVETLKKCSIDGLGNLTPDHFFAIWEKFNRDQEYLRAIWKLAKEKTPHHVIERLAQEALSFDPLSDSLPSQL